jgi:hypothetical protein
VIADPIGAFTTQSQDEAPDLPAGVFDAHASYPISALMLDERGEKNLAALADAERAEQRDRDRELTVRAVEQLRTSAGWQAWLRVRARTGLRRYSVLISGAGVADDC